MGLVVAASVIAFLTTEMDSLAVMVVLFCGSDTHMKKSAVAFGRYIGLALLVACSFFFPEQLTSCHIKEKLALLGIIPIVVGIRTGVAHRKDSNRQRSAFVSLALFFLACLFSVVVTVSNGGDNISVYIPFLKSLNAQ
ncbi:MAG: cadmium resistance transporter [Treponema sp.]|nr:cadmium resistance transporter [Treponema sp.]